MRYETKIRPVRVSDALGKLIYHEESYNILTRQLYCRSREEIERDSVWWISSFSTPEEILKQIEYLEEYHCYSTNDLIQCHYADCINALKEYGTLLMEESIEKLKSFNEKYFKARQSLFDMNTSIEDSFMADFNGVNIKVSKRHVVDQTSKSIKECRKNIQSIANDMIKIYGGD